MSRYLSRSTDRFDNYREITAKFPSTGKCGHEIKKGDTIGYHRVHGCHCANCWQRWSAENREAAAYEASLPAGMSEGGW